MRYSKKLIIRHILSFLFLMGMVAMAEFSGMREIIFPEMVALVTGFWLSDHPPWQSGPVKLVILMTVCALAGVLLARTEILLLGKVAIGYVMVAVVLMLYRTTLYPLISACVLPVMINTKDFFYVGVVFALSVILVVGRTLLMRFDILPEDGTSWEYPETSFQDVVVWLVTIGVFLVYAAYPLTFGNPYFVAPPLIVAYTAMMRADYPLSQIMPVKPGVMMVLCAATGFLARFFLMEGVGLPMVAAAAVSLCLYFAYMVILDLRHPPAGAAMLLPFLLPEAGLETYPVLVAVSTVSLTLICFICRGVINDE